MHPLPGRKNAAAQAQTVTGKIPAHPLLGKKPLLAGQTSPRYLGQPPIRLRFYPVKNPPAQTAYSGIQHHEAARMEGFFDAIRDSMPDFWGGASSNAGPAKLAMGPRDVLEDVF